MCKKKPHPGLPLKGEGKSPPTLVGEEVLSSPYKGED